MRTFSTADELREAVGTDLGSSDWLTMDQSRIDVFASCTGDVQWIHIDPDRAADGPFGATIAHGFLTLSLIPLLGGQVLRFETSGAQLNYGVNKVRFPAPLTVGSAVRARAQIQEVRSVSAGTQVLTRYTIEIADHEKPACVAETVTLLLA